jgi:hypothetical protein
MNRIAAFALLMLVASPLSASAQYYCDPAGEPEDRYRIMGILADVDAACPCDEAESRSSYKRCVKETLDELQTTSAFSDECRSVLAAHGKRSTCGRPGSSVCCRVGTTGKPRHIVVREPSKCVDTSRYATCLSPLTSTISGCESSGCAASVCGNGFVEAGEDCEPPGTQTCDSGCIALVPPLCSNGVIDPGEECDPPFTTTCNSTCRLCTTVDPLCGNLVIDAGETCDPPGVGACTFDCQAASCTAAAPGETEVACVLGTPTVSAAGSDSGFLITWDAAHARERRDVLARRFAPDGTPADATATVVTEDSICVSHEGGASATSDGSGYYVGWQNVTAGGPVSSNSTVVRSRSLGGVSGMGTRSQFSQGTGVGSCQTFYRGPVRTGPVASSLFGLSWMLAGNCAGSDPLGRIIDVSGAEPDATTVAIGYGFPGYPENAGRTVLDSLAGSTLWVSSDSVATMPVLRGISGVWSDGLATGSRFGLSTTTDIASEPVVSAGDSSFLVAWRQAADNSATAITEIRAIRVTRASGRIDANGGLLLATVPGGIAGGPSVAFDGSRWLVAWTETAMVGYDVRAIALETDATVVDASPRLVASQVAPQAPVLAPGDGNVLVVFRRTDSVFSAIRSLLVVP